MYTSNKPVIPLVLITLVILISLACGSSTPTNAPVNVFTQAPVNTQVNSELPSVPPMTTEVPASARQVPATPTIIPASPTKVPAKATNIPALPTPSAPPLEILSSQSYVDAGWYHIVGEVRNNTDDPMEFVKIIATLHDDNNNITGTDFTYTELDVIPPGGKSPFETGTDQYAGTTIYKLQVQGDPGVLGRQDLVISGDSSYEDYGWLHIQGEVQNTGTTPAEFVKLIVTLYDANGNVVGMDFSYTELDTIPAGGSSPFETGTDHYPNYDHFEIQVQGS